MPEQKKTEEQLRHDARRKFGFSEETDKERIDTAVEMEKDRFKAVQKKQELKKELEKSGKPAGNKDPEGNKQGSSPLSLKDIRALNDVHDDDVDDITDYAKYKGISIAEAKGTPAMKNLLSAKAEERKTAEASNTGGGKRGSSNASGKALLKKLEDEGKAPESDKDMNAMLDERFSPSS